MKRTILLSIVVFSVILVALNALSATSLPDQANAGDRKLDKITFIHYRNYHAKPPCNNDGICDPGEKKNCADCPNGGGGPKCYSFLSKGVKWKDTEPYYVNPTNNDGLSQNFVFNSVNAGVNEWETYGGEIFNSGYISYSVSYNNGNLDDINTVSFGYYPNSGVIAVTTVWGYWSGPPQYREIVEWDMLFNDYYYPFGDATTNPSVMDLRNLATHELGHSAGMGDLYNLDCYEETMFGYSDYGETYKRDLADGDITGIQELYS